MSRHSLAAARMTGGEGGTREDEQMHLWLLFTLLESQILPLWSIQLIKQVFTAA